MWPSQDIIRREVIKIKYVTVNVTAEDVTEDEPNNQLETHLTTIPKQISCFALINFTLEHLTAYYYGL